MIRQISSNEERRRKEERNKKILVIILALIMLMSSAGYFANDLFGNKAKIVTYNGIKFTQTDYSTWKANIGGISIETKYNANQTKDITNTAKKTLADYTNKPLYFAAEPEFSSPEASYELATVLNNYAARMDNACVTANCTADYATKDCSKDNIILFTLSGTNSTEISSKDNCVYVKYAPGDSVIGADAFLFRLLGLQ